MPPSIVNIREALTKNRAEEIGHDVWSDFVIPLFYEDIDLNTAAKPRIVIGGRGCGKTTLLRYFSYRTRFSKAREDIPRVELSNIGLYWRADTQFVNAMTGVALSERDWQNAFDHSLALSISLEILRSIHTISRSSAATLLGISTEQLTFEQLSAFNSEFPYDFDGLIQTLRSQEWRFQTWLNNLTSTPPTFLPARHFVGALISILKEQVASLKETNFAVFIDEYENLQRYQQRVLNTSLKHSEPPLIFHLAMKKNGMLTRETLGEESITDIADYRTIDLDELLKNHQFDVFAAEILLARLSRVPGLENAFDVKSLNDPSLLAARRNASYQKRVLATVKSILPRLSQIELADTIFSDSALLDKLKRSIQKILRARGSGLKAELYIRQNHKQASVIVPALLHRSSLSPEVVLAELRLLDQGKDNRFTGSTGWIHNNFEGCLLYLYAPYDRPCPFYGGYETFIVLAQANLRHFLELCYDALQHADEYAGAAIQVPPREQAEAAKRASATFLMEVKGFGKRGNQLHSFVLTLGSLFALSQLRPSQSEPEVSHFGISSGDTNFEPVDDEFFREAVKWSVLVEHAETKLKDPLQPAGIDWALNPIYAPYFHITYRKKRKLDLSVQDIQVLIRGSYEQRKILLKKFYEKWAIEPDATQPTLFSHLLD